MSRTSPGAAAQLQGGGPPTSPDQKKWLWERRNQMARELYDTHIPNLKELQAYLNEVIVDSRSAAVTAAANQKKKDALLEQQKQETSGLAADDGDGMRLRLPVISN